MNTHLPHPSCQFPALGIDRSLHRIATQFPRPSLRLRISAIRSATARLPFLEQKAGYYKELEAAVDAVERACRLCVDVKSSLLSNDKRILEKNDQTPVTIADFGVQALISLELGKLFPSIPLVAEEDSSFLKENNLANLVVNEVADKSSLGDESLTETIVLEAIDRGGKDAFAFGAAPATYWVLDPIDGTKGFLKGDEALYVVGLALVVEGRIVLGVMGCPNWKNNASDGSVAGSGTIMASHVGCGTWSKRLPISPGGNSEMTLQWTKCAVDSYSSVHDAGFCISDSQTWDYIPLSSMYDSITEPGNVSDKEIRLVAACCGSLCKYLMVASGRASIFILRNKAEKIIKAWDHVVGVICVHEAGGRVTDWAGNELDLAMDQIERRIISPSDGILVSNGSLHDQILGLVSS